MGQVNELKSFTRGQLDAALMKIGQDAGLGTCEGIEAFLRDELRVVKPEKPQLLSLVRTFTASSAKPTIGSSNESFKSWFDGVLAGEHSRELTLHKLKRNGLDVHIIAALGGEEKAEVSLADFFSALAEKEKADDHTWVIAYVRDAGGILRVVSARWFRKGCDVYADPVGSVGRWGAGNQALSRGQIPARKVPGTLDMF